MDFFRRTKLIILAPLFAFILSLVSAPVEALSEGDIVLEVSPAEQELDLAPGETYQGHLSIKNAGRLPLTFTLSVAPYQVIPETYDPDFTTVNSQTLLKDWVTFEQDKYSLQPNEYIQIKYLVTTPDDVPEGGQYAAILIETHDSIDPDESFGVIGRIAVTLRAHLTGQTRAAGSIISMNTPAFLLASPISATATIENSGNVDFQVAQTLEVKNFFTNNTIFNEETHKSALATPIIMPGTSRTSAIIWDDAPALGLFRVKHVISYLDQTETSETIVIRCPLILAILALIFLAALIIWFILRLIDRRRRKTIV